MSPAFPEAPQFLSETGFVVALSLDVFDIWPLIDGLTSLPLLVERTRKMIEIEVVTHSIMLLLSWSTSESANGSLLHSFL